MSEFDWYLVSALTVLAIAWLVIVSVLITKHSVQADEVMRRLEREHLL